MVKKRLRAKRTLKETQDLVFERDKLTEQLTGLQRQICRLQLEKDVLKKAVEVKKG